MSSMDLRRRLDEVDDSISGLQYTRVSLVRQLNTMAAPACPILSKLSSEVTSEIFLHCPSSIGPRDTPMLLLSVCKAWRTIALFTPELWATLNLDFDCLPWGLFDEKGVENFVEGWIGRAGAFPLISQLRLGYMRQEEERRSIPAIIKRLSSRIQHLELRIDRAGYPEDTPGFPILRSLTLALPFQRSGDQVNTSIFNFGAAPQLRKVRMYAGATPSLFALPWENITVFDGDMLLSRDCVEVLRLAPSLVECTLSHPAERDPDTPSVCHSSLKSLTLQNSILSEFLALPALQHLDLSCTNTDSTHLLPFISGFSTSLLTLSWTQSLPPAAWLSGMLVLADLKLTGLSSAYLTEFFALFDRTKVPESFLPQLQVLELHRCPPYVNTTLVDALASRCLAAEDGDARLRSFRQIWPYNTPADALQGYYRASGFGAALEELVEKGLEIYIGHATKTKNPGGWLFN
ncbi:hypothetical protein B0H14DRAFT_3146798 [Mycena olivaceomarginata]|nr:hypothetical protein B0H14DRAFT_3146798 [Mycena olivaceomarginata]